jgi:hypothetical protein
MTMVLKRSAYSGWAGHEGQERRLKQWDFVHCPPETRHASLGAGDRPCVLLCASSRQFQKDAPWGFYWADETAARYNASSPEDTQDAELAGHGQDGHDHPARARHDHRRRHDRSDEITTGRLEVPARTLTRFETDEE